MNTEDKRKQFDEILDAHLNGDTSRDVELHAMAAADPDLAARLHAAETVAAGLADMNDIDPGPVFSERIKEALPRAPRIVPFSTRQTGRISVVLRVAAAVTLTVAGLAIGYFIGRGTAPPVSPVAMTTAGTSVVPVKFIFFAPTAARVSVVGNFNDWNENAHTLVKSPNGWWTLEIAFQPGRYNYLYLVDGERWSTDPASTLLEEDGFGRKNSVLDI